MSSNIQAPIFYLSLFPTNSYIILATLQKSVLIKVINETHVVQSMNTTYPQVTCPHSSTGYTWFHGHHILLVFFLPHVSSLPPPPNYQCGGSSGLSPGSSPLVHMISSFTSKWSQFEKVYLYLKPLLCPVDLAC